MINKQAFEIKKYLESFYDIPFDVKYSSHDQVPQFNIKPQNYTRELFDISVKFKDNLRLIIEVHPEKYAAASINDMAHATNEGKSIFVEYAKQLFERKAKTKFLVNNMPCDLTNPQAWPSDWNNYSLRVTRSPICAENETFDEIEITISWALIITGMFLSLLDVTRIEDEHSEGGLKRIEINRYERNPVNRILCLVANGYTCGICGFDFEKTYGNIGHHFIHVHHIVPVSEMTEAYMINPTKDMIPVCPNCHAMLHRKSPPFSPDELRDQIRSNVFNSPDNSGVI